MNTVLKTNNQTSTGKNRSKSCNFLNFPENQVIDFSAGLYSSCKCKQTIFKAKIGIEILGRLF